MKKITCSVIALCLSTLSATAFACPKGTTLQGGEGPHHKGGKCVLASGVNTKATDGTKNKVENKFEKKEEVVKDKVKPAEKLQQPTEKPKSVEKTVPKI